MNITFRQLRVFTEVAKRQSMIRAAETLHLSSPAVSMQIKEVEAQVGLSLFDLLMGVRCRSQRLGSTSSSAPDGCSPISEKRTTPWRGSNGSNTDS